MAAACNLALRGLSRGFVWHAPPAERACLRDL